jgi:hypothetical protein
MKKIAATAFVILWLLTLVLVLVWDQNPLSILACALGVGAALLVAFRLRWWRAVGASASLLFAVNWALAVVQMGAGAPVEAYAAVVQSATQSNALVDASIVLGYELMLPPIHLAVAVALTAGLMRKRAS